MVDTTASSTPSTQTLGFEDLKFWGDLQITKLESDPIRWNRDWNKALSSLSASEVYTRMALPYSKESWDHEKTPEHMGFLVEKLCKAQDTLVKIWTVMSQTGGLFINAWTLLGEKERIRHLIKGFESRFPPILFGQDGRALAPDITTTSMLKQNGQVFLQMINKHVNGKKGMVEGSPYLLPSEWWDNTLKEVPRSVIDKVDESTHKFLTLHRNIFIASFLINSIMSVVYDLRFGSPGMDPVITFMKEDGRFAAAISRTMASELHEPIIRCENCTKSAENIGKDTKFMQCSRCKTKLNFIVHYCSVECQKQDWPNHKKHCGKQKIAKKLAGTIHDPFWFQPETPDYLRGLPFNDNGGVEMTSLGFPNPATAPPQSPALQRQLSLLTADKEADYFLFDELDRPVRFELNNGEKVACRIVRGGAFSTSDHEGIEALMEHIIKTMGQEPGLSRERIVAQFKKEYGKDAVDRFAKFEGRPQGGRVRRTLIETLGHDIMRLEGCA